jgi:hypothetical protein
LLKEYPKAIEDLKGWMKMRKMRKMMKGGR